MQEPDDLPPPWTRRIHDRDNGSFVVALENPYSGQKFYGHGESCEAANREAFKFLAAARPAHIDKEKGTRP